MSALKEENCILGQKRSFLEGRLILTKILISKFDENRIFKPKIIIFNTKSNHFYQIHRPKASK